jgi:hypothetical protein
VTNPAWAQPPRSRRRTAAALLLIIAPLPLAVLLLVIGLFGSLVWVYLSIAMSVLWLPCLVVGVLLLVRRNRGDWTFTPPPGWPSAPAGWTPPPGWQPDPSWPAPPNEWSWWGAPPTTA